MGDLCRQGCYEALNKLGEHRRKQVAGTVISGFSEGLGGWWQTRAHPCVSAEPTAHRVSGGSPGLITGSSWGGLKAIVSPGTDFFESAF